MSIGGEANGVAVPIAPRERLDLADIAQRRPQDRTVAHTGSRLAGGGIEKSGHGSAWGRMAEQRVTARENPTTGIEDVFAQGNVLARDVGLPGGAAIGFADNAAVRR